MTVLRRLNAGLSTLAGLWLKEWEASLPDGLRAGEKPDRARRLVLSPQDEHLEVKLIDSDGQESFSDRIALADYDRSILDRWLERAAAQGGKGRIGLTLALPQAVTQSLVIPQQAQGRADAIIHESIARRTPLKPEELFIGYDLREAGRGKLELRYLLLPRSALDQLLTQLSVAQSEIAALEGPSFAGAQPVSVPFLRPSRRSSRWFWRLSLALAAIAALGLVTGYAALAWRQADLISRMDAQIADASAPVLHAAEPANSPLGLAEDVARFTELRGAPGIVEIWEDLARILPDPTYLTELEINGVSLRASGYSDSAPGLIPLLEKSAIVQGTAFAGPLVFDRAKGKEHFTLRASLRTARLPADEVK